MSYRLINSNEIAIKYPEVNEMDCIYVDLPNGLDNEYHYIDSEPKHGHWIGIDDYPYETWECDRCGKIIEADEPPNYCERCGAKMDEVDNET